MTETAETDRAARETTRTFIEGAVVRADAPVAEGENAFSILGQYQRLAKEQGIAPSLVSKVFSLATSGDYQHLLAVIRDHTGENPR